MVDDENQPPPQPPSPSSSARKNTMTTVSLELSPDHELPIQRANPGSPTKSATMPALEPTSSLPSKSFIEPMKDKDDSFFSTQLTEKEQTQPLYPAKTENNERVTQQIQQPNDRRSVFEESGAAKNDLEPVYSKSNEDLNSEEWERDSSHCENESPIRSFLHQKKRRLEAQEGMMASEVLKAEFDFNARMDAQWDRSHLHQSSNSSNDARDDARDFERATKKGFNAISSYFSRLNYVPWESFQRLGETGSPFAIDVLVGEPEPKVMSMFPRMAQPTAATRTRQGAKTAQAQEGDAVPLAMPPNHAQRSKMPEKPVTRSLGPLPERIRINSPEVIKLLDKISRKGDKNKSSEPLFYPLLMMQPFRALVYYKDEIRNWRASSEADVKESAKAKTPEPEVEPGNEIEPEDENKSDLASHDGETSNAMSGTSSESEEQSIQDGQEIDLGPILNTLKAVDDINCLVEFIDNELEGRIAYLASNDCQRVAFSDIWLLFKPGELVLSKDEKQAFRVINTEYPKHSMKLPSPRDFWRYGAQARLEDFPIKIHCVYIDFDGERLGPVLKIFPFYRFEGEKSIRSLDIIPLRLAKNANKLQEALIKRGSTFIEACGTGRLGIPMHYSGLTLDTKEEVDSQVVLDFEEAFAGRQGNIRNTKRTGLTTEQVFLEVMAQEYVAEVKKDGKVLHVLQDLDLTASSWKPVIEDIDVQEDSVEDGDVADDYYKESGDSLPRRARGSRRKGNLHCIPECCDNENVYNDTYAERRRSNDFILDQFREQETGSLVISSRPFKESTGDKDFITDSEKLIVTYRAFGFIMRSRKWAQLDLTYLGPARGENTFDLLVLPPGHRNMVESLVTQHYLDKASTSDETDEMDIVRGKGTAPHLSPSETQTKLRYNCKGLIILLHGPPGTGKTTTAGDLGSTADAVERSLEENFALASRWGCILLIDEADVFLEARQTENFDRNIFLRTLEYYTGILFLTTNRVGTFDEAFTSRIHISLYYPPLDASSTLAVFHVNLDRIKERFRKKKERGTAELELHERSINKFILEYYDRNEEARWNGRQIRNACQTALALAEFEAQKAANPGVAGGRSVMEIAAASSKMIKVKMTAKHFHDVAKAYLAFMKYLREVHGMSAAQQAKSFRLRQDRYGLGEPSAGLGLLASRQRGGTGSGSGGHWKPVQKQGSRGMGMRRPNLGVHDGYMEEDLEEYGRGEEYAYGEEQDEEEVEEEELEDEEEGKEEEDLEDEQAAEENEDEHWDEEFQKDSEYLYEEQPKARPQPAGRGRGVYTRGRGQQQIKNKVPATARPRADGLSRGKGVVSATTTAERSSGLPAKATRGNHLPPGLGRGRGRGAAGPSRKVGMTSRHE
ncbi:LOW QUALITY PROTEIN: hypothetical protein MKX08_002621 [Trichoderma sp. CBMAI-0020]|nr:LOW QUALITY PROTEIN: hypothetical protein MKX08_002621 [Trichoderma sp. CBMAI-0020]